MLERLFGSTTRLKLIKHFLFRPEEVFSLVDLAKIVKIKSESLKRELDNLTKLGFINLESVPEIKLESDDLVENSSKSTKAKAKKKEVKLYFLNKQFIITEELKTLIVRAQILYERDFIDKLLTIGNIKMLVLTGMFVNRDDSPVDLLVVGKINRPKLSKIITDFEKELGREINFSHLEQAEFIYRRNIADVFVYQILEGNKIIVIDEINS